MYWVFSIGGGLVILGIEQFWEWNWRRKEEKAWRELLESDYFDD